MERTIGLLCLAIMPKTAKAVRESNPLSYPHQRDLSIVRYTFGQVFTPLTKAKGNALTDNKSVLSIARKS